MTINYDALNAARATAYAQAQTRAPREIQEKAYRAINSLFSKVSKAVSPFFAHLKETSLNAIESIKDLSYRAVEWIKDYPNSPKFANIGAIIGVSLMILGVLSPLVANLLGAPLAAIVVPGLVIAVLGVDLAKYSLKNSLLGKI